MFLIIILLLIVLNAILIYYMLNLSGYSKENPAVENSAESSQTEVDTIANILNSKITNNENTNTNVDTTDVNNRKNMNENLIVLYKGLVLDTTKMDQVEPKYIDNTSTNKDKYEITYYNYEKFAYVDSTVGQLNGPIFDNLVDVKNHGKISISEDYNAIPREIKVVNTLPTVVSNNNKLSEFDMVKTIIADLDGNGTDEYIAILANKKTGYSKISLFDSSGKLISDLSYIEKSNWYQSQVEEFYLSLDNVDIIDVDNDNIMEMLVEIPAYEGESSVSILKYKNGELTGKTNIECSILP